MVGKNDDCGVIFLTLAAPGEQKSEVPGLSPIEAKEFLELNNLREQVKKTAPRWRTLCRMVDKAQAAREVANDKSTECSYFYGSL